jgi:hypothetical protein
MSDNIIVFEEGRAVGLSHALEIIAAYGMYGPDMEQIKIEIDKKLRYIQNRLDAMAERAKNETPVQGF